MLDAYDALYLSPHLDDAVLSCGGRIYQDAQAGKRILVATLVTGDPVEPLPAFARRFHEMCGLGLDIMQVRREEDKRAADLLGCDVFHAGLQDAVYRLDPEGERALYPDHQAVLGRGHPADTAFRESVAEVFQRLPEHGQVFVPLGVGGHVDHRIAREVAEQSAAKDILYYEDYPYAKKWWSVRFVVRPRRAWTSKITSLGQGALQAKVDAIAAYPTQMDMLFRGTESMGKKVRRHARRIGGERFWSRQEHS